MYAMGDRMERRGLRARATQRANIAALITGCFGDGVKRRRKPYYFKKTRRIKRIVKRNTDASQSSDESHATDTSGIANPFH